MNNKKELTIVIITIIVVAILMATKTFQNDTFYSIKVGEVISKYGVDMLDHFSYHNLAYSYPHWFYDLIIYYVYSLFSYDGLYVFNILSFIVLGVVFFLCQFKNK